jgi:hypothetical protein
MDWRFYVAHQIAWVFFTHKDRAGADKSALELFLVANVMKHVDGIQVSRDS